MSKKYTRNYIYAVSIIAVIIFPIYTIAQKALKVFILAGQSNMVGHGEVYANGNRRAVGSLEYEVAHDSTGLYKNLRDNHGHWKVRKDVWVRFDRVENGLKKGDLTVGFGSSDTEIGPELQFGNVMGDHFSEQVLLIKTAWGGKSLGVDFRPTGSGGATGVYYKKIIEDIHTTLNNLAKEFKDYKGQGYELAGIVWNQGWNDGGDSVLFKEYKTNMVHFIKDIRLDLQAPDLPFVIINCGQGGFQSTRDKWMTNVQKYIAQAQADAAASPEFSGNVALVDSKPFWKDSLDSPAREIHHYNRNAGTYFLMGNASGHAMIQLLNKQKSIKIKTASQNREKLKRQINSSGLKGYFSFRASQQPAGYASGTGFYSGEYQKLTEPDLLAGGILGGTAQEINNLKGAFGWFSKLNKIDCIRLSNCFGKTQSMSV